MSKRVAVLDLGTNTFHLLIAEVTEGKNLRTLYQEQRHVKLGEGGINSGTITPAAFARGLDALLSFSQTLSKYNVEVTRAVGTAALRSAENGHEFIKSVHHQTGIAIETISGDQEASLIYYGVREAVDLSQPSLIMDIGGGSVEFIIADAQFIYWKKSFPVGAAKLMAQFHRNDPISGQEVKNIELHLEAVLEELIAEVANFEALNLVGSAGAFETFAALCEQKVGLGFQAIETAYAFNFEGLCEVLAEIIVSQRDDRNSNPAILSVRKDMIVVASVLTRFVITRLNIGSVELSAYALKEGLLFSSLTLDK